MVSWPWNWRAWDWALVKQDVQDTWSAWGMTHKHGKLSIHWVKKHVSMHALKLRLQVPCERGPKATLKSKKVNKCRHKGPPSRGVNASLSLSLSLQLVAVVLLSLAQKVQGGQLSYKWRSFQNEPSRLMRSSQRWCKQGSFWLVQQGVTIMIKLTLPISFLWA